MKSSNDLKHLKTNIINKQFIVKRGEKTNSIDYKYHTVNEF